MLIIIKGAGDLATGIAYRLYQSGFKVLMTEVSRPTVVRHTVAFAQAIYDGTCEVEGVRATYCQDLEAIQVAHDQGVIPIVVDPEGTWIKVLVPEVVVDAIIAKRNLGTRQTDANLVIGVGPGFCAGEDCHYVIETKRGHYLGRVITEGEAIPNTGVPGDIAGFSHERIIRAPKEGIFTASAKIGDHVHKGDVVGHVDETLIVAQLEGTVRGMLRSGLHVTTGYKCGDIDPRCAPLHCFTISDKSRAIGGGVLEAIMRGRPNNE